MSDEIEFKLFPSFSVEDFKEIIDNLPLLLIVIVSVVWVTIAILLNFAVANIWGIATVLLFVVGIFGGISIFNMAGIKTDFKERKSIFVYTFMTVIGLALILVSAIVFTSIYQQQTLYLLWRPFNTNFQVSEQLNPAFANIYLNFKSFSEAVNIDTNLLYNCLTAVFLVSPGEELVFRGVLIYFLARTLRSPWTAGLISNAVWATIHSIVAYQGPEMLMYVLTAYIGGFILFYFMVLTKDITVPIFIHGTYDCLVYLMQELGFVIL